MTPTTLRQIKDIQFQADRLVNQRATIHGINEFNQYNEELKKYLIENLNDQEIVDRVKQIPKILEEAEKENGPRSFFVSILMLFAPAFVNYYRDKQLIEDAKEYIREARGKYASIEFLLKKYA